EPEAGTVRHERLRQQVVAAEDEHVAFRAEARNGGRIALGTQRIDPALRADHDGAHWIAADDSVPVQQPQLGQLAATHVKRQTFTSEVRTMRVRGPAHAGDMRVSHCATAYAAPHGALLQT